MKKLVLTLIMCLVWIGSAWAHSDIDNLPPAVAVLSYKQILYLKPDDLTARNGLAMALVRTNKLQEAQKELQYVLEKDPNNFDALDGYAVLLIKVGKHKDALQYLSKAAGINKQDAMLYVHLSVVYDKMKQRDKAQAALRKAQALASPEELKKIEAERRFLYGR
jgi:Flp pilus assembly protein TadD